MSATEEVVVGRIGRPHGVRGELSVEVRSDEPERRFHPGAVLGCRRPGPGPAVARPWLRVAEVRRHQDGLLVSFEEVTDRTAAEALRGLLLVATVPAEEAPEDPEEFYDHQLVGLHVETTEGSPVGVVAEVLHTGAQDLLVVRRQGADDALVPFVGALVPEVDVAGGRVVVEPVPGLLDPAEGA